jgi:hypothetical protein
VFTLGWDANKANFEAATTVFGDPPSVTFTEGF